MNTAIPSLISLMGSVDVKHHVYLHSHRQYSPSPSHDSNCHTAALAPSRQSWGTEEVPAHSVAEHVLYKKKKKNRALAPVERSIIIRCWQRYVWNLTGGIAVCSSPPKISPHYGEKEEEEEEEQQ